MTKPKQRPTEPQAVDPGEKRFDDHSRLTRIPGLKKGEFKNATATPLDAYRHSGVITEQQFEAGDHLRQLWAVAGLEPRVVGSLQPRVDAEHEVESDEDAEKRAKAWRRYLERRDKLSKIQGSVVINVACWGRGAESVAKGLGMPEHMGLVVLIEALEELRR